MAPSPSVRQILQPHHLQRRDFQLKAALASIPHIIWSLFKMFLFLAALGVSLVLIFFAAAGLGYLVFGGTPLAFQWLQRKWAERRKQEEGAGEELEGLARPVNVEEENEAGKREGAD